MPFFEADHNESSSEGLLPPLIAILGPTACGKSEVAMSLARCFGCEILNSDSRQIYREMEIGTAKPGRMDRQEIPHHLLDLVSPDETFSAGEFARQGRLVLAKLWASGGLPLLVGGTGFYYEALTRGLPDINVDKNIRHRLQEMLELDGTFALVDELRRIDPAAALSIDISNPRRVMRALEIIHATGRPLSEARAEVSPLHARILPIVVDFPRDMLCERMEQRIQNMLTMGLRDEVKRLNELYDWSAPGMRTIGYAEWRSYFQGETDLDDTVEQINIHTRQYAKRQVTWFKRRPGVEPIDLSEPGAESRIKFMVRNFLTAK
ncbi:MAG: tRNA (adenosine(37)-N6)-dimethylallyltransferase MiaA [Candidatus Riflebacteria bacterium]|nr:tRNA (adenosine(37)-N6)-dimethylallyltransferase MiaA [Candidatus Riflebacteria bacterium]